MTQDSFETHSRSLTTPPDNAAEITPSDTEGLPFATRAIFCGGGGDVRLRMLGGAEVTLTGVAPGSLLPLRVAQVFATGTTASGLVGFW